MTNTKSNGSVQPQGTLAAKDLNTKQHTMENMMSHENIIRAWKDTEFRKSLSANERSLLPENPAGLVELTDAPLEGVVVGNTIGGAMMNIRRKLINVLCATLTSAAVAVVLGTAAHAADPYRQVSNWGSSKCLDVRAQDNYYAEGARVQQYHCTGVAEQKWALNLVTYSDNYGPLYQLKSLRSGLCMEVRDASQADGAQVDQQQF